MRKRTVMIMMILLCVLLPGTTAYAHKVGLFAYREGGTVHTEAYFVDGTPCRNAEITAVDADGAMVAEGMTDDEGRFSFPYALTGDLTITARAGAGHGSKFLLTADRAGTAETPSEGEEMTGGDLEGDPDTGGSGSLDEYALKNAIEERVGPFYDLLAEIRKNQEKPTLAKILGGLGWIVGMAGAYLWGVSRGREDRRKKVEGGSTRTKD